MKNALYPSLTVQRVPRWVREALRIEARILGKPAGEVLADWARTACTPHVVDIAQARANLKTSVDAASAGFPNKQALLAYLRQPLPPELRGTARERMRAQLEARHAATLPAPDPGTGTAPAQLGEESERRGHFAPIRLAPDSDT